MSENREALAWFAPGRGDRAESFVMHARLADVIEQRDRAVAALRELAEARAMPPHLRDAVYRALDELGESEDGACVRCYGSGCPACDARELEES